MLKNPISADDHMQGDPDAPLLLVEYGDYQCPHCGRAYPIVQQIQKHFGKKLAFVFRNFPLREAHEFAETAAETAEFAGTHKKFWQMHDALFENQENFSPDFFLKLAANLTLPPEALLTALESEQFASRVQTDFLGGVRSGVNGTPTFFINGNRHNGPWEFEDLVAALEEKLPQA